MGINISNHHSLLLPITTTKHSHFTSHPLHLLLKINQSPKSIKMQSVIALTVAFLAAAVSATPYTATTTVQFTNDQSGRSANVPVALDGAKKSVATLLDNTPLDNNYSFLATSFFLQSNFQGVECDLYIDNYVVTITEQHTFAGFAPVSAPKDLVHAEIACFKY